MRGNHLQYGAVARLAAATSMAPGPEPPSSARIMTPRSVGFSMSLATTAMVLLARGENEDARATLERAVAVAREQNGPLVLFPALQLLAVAEQPARPHRRCARASSGRHAACARDALRRRGGRCSPGRSSSRSWSSRSRTGSRSSTRARWRPGSGCGRDRRAIARWPWPLAIRALGRFELVRDGVPLEVRGKAQKKPLDLLKALSRSARRAWMPRASPALLWPDAEGDAAKHSFDTTLYRLRKLLGRDELLVLAEGKLSLDREQCWLDVRAFERIAASEPTRRAPNRPATKSRVARSRGPRGLSGTLPRRRRGRAVGDRAARPVAREARAHRARAGRAAAGGGPMDRGGGALRARPRARQPRPRGCTAGS